MPTSEGGYKQFKIGDLFDVDHTWIYGKNKQYATRFKNRNDNLIPVISGITVNNGINYYTADDLLPEETFYDCLTISTRGEYSGTVTYHDGAFCLANNILVMATPPEWSRRAKLYLGALISKLGYGGYNGYPRKETLKKDYIYLPITKQGTIDFNFIESRVRELEEERVRELEAYLTASNFSDCSLTLAEKNALSRVQSGSLLSKTTKIVDFFKVSNSHNILKSDVVFGSGKTPYVTACEGNNSIVSYVEYKDELKEEGNTIMIGGKTLVVTFQPNAYFSNDSHNLVLTTREEKARNENIQLYLVSALYKSLKPKYHWGDSISKAKIQNDTFVLPVQSDGSIDYDFIENYINAVKKQTIARVKEYIEREHNAYMQVVEGSEDSIEQTITPIQIYDTYLPGRIPLYTLRAACGYFEDDQVPEEEGWIDASGLGFTPDPKRHFAVHAKGDSMLPKIKDGDICIFEWYNAGSRDGEIVLSQSREYDTEYGGKYTIKRYHSEKVVTEEGWQHSKVELQPLNLDFEPIELDEFGDYKTIGIFKCVL